MTSTGTFKGFQDGSRNSSKVLKPPGGGSSDIFGSGSEVDSPRRAKQNYNQSQLGSSFFGDQVQQEQQQQQQQQQQQPSSNGSSAPETPRTKPGNDSQGRPNDPSGTLPPSTPHSKYHMRNLALRGSCTEPNLPASIVSNASNDKLANGNGHNDLIGGSSCMPRNPVTGDGVDIAHHATRRMIPRTRDGNPVTGAGYEPHAISSSIQHNGISITDTPSSIGSDKSSTDSSPSAGGVTRMKNRVPPGGYSSGLW